MIPFAKSQADSRATIKYRPAQGCERSLALTLTARSWRELIRRKTARDTRYRHEQQRGANHHKSTIRFIGNRQARLSLARQQRQWPVWFYHRYLHFHFLFNIVAGLTALLRQLRRYESE